MADFTLVLKLFVGLFLINFAFAAKPDRIHIEGYLGEKDIDFYSERYQPLILQDIYQGKITFADDVFFQNFFQQHLFQTEKDYTQFLKSELNGGLICSNELLSEHFDDIRFSYRLITLSYLLEGVWHLKMTSDHFGQKNGCQFDLKDWVKTCKPQSFQMKKFIERISSLAPRYDEHLSIDYKKEDWWKEYNEKKFKWYSHYRINADCGAHCRSESIFENFQKTCEHDQKLMTLICSEKDQIYGLSTNRDAYYLIGISNIINTYNKRGEALGCLRRFSELMSHKEVRYDVLNQLFPSLQTFLRQRHNERFLQGRVFFFGSGKEFEEKGLTDFYVKDRPLKIARTEDIPQVPSIPKIEIKPVPLAAPSLPIKDVPPKPIKEIKHPSKSAFLLAAELRAGENLNFTEVDMLKLKYDYVFSLNMMNTLSKRLNSFMTREALLEMTNFDKLGSKEAPVPLLFLKFMIDMQEHQGLWNISSIVGDKFFVSNDIDQTFKTVPEFVQLSNNHSTGNQWQLYILRP